MAVTNAVSIQTATITNGGTTSGTVYVGAAQTICGIQMPSAFTGTALTFQVSADGVTYAPLYDTDGTQISYTVAASRGYAVDPATFAGWPFVKVVSGSTEGGSRAITLLVRPV